MKGKFLSERQLVQYKRRVLRDADLYGVAQTSRRYGIHRDTLYRWRKEVLPQKRGPHTPVPWQTERTQERMVIRMRKKTNYGPKRIQKELELFGIRIGEKAIRGVLERCNLVRKHRKKRQRTKQKFYAPYPGYRVQMDTKTVPDPDIDLRSPKRYQFTAIDICTKIRFLLLYDELSNANALDFLKKALQFYTEIGISVECVQTDNHITFTNLYAGGNKKEDHELIRIHPFTQYCLDHDITHLLSRPARPQDNCFVERSHRIDEEEFYYFLSLPSLSNAQLSLRLKQWEYTYNFLRLHSSCNYLPPFKFFSTVGCTGA